ncbi:MAG: site-specific integrase [Hyphomicrobiaceae bacterium]|nr:site-specific integrase [Hyphomicrobiaceae bacterium]
MDHMLEVVRRRERPDKRLVAEYDAALDGKIKALDAAMPNGANRHGELVSEQLRLQAMKGELSILELAHAGAKPTTFTAGEIAAYQLLVQPDFKDQLAFTFDLSPLLDIFTARELRDRISRLKQEVAALEAKIADHAAFRADLHIPSLATSQADAADDPANPLLLTAFAEWLAAEKQSDETAKKYAVYIRRLAEHVGNIPVRSIRKLQVVSFLKLLETVPDSNRLPPPLRRSMSMAELIKARRVWLEKHPEAEPDDWRLITAATVNKHLEAIKALLGWVASNQEDYTNVARDVRRRKETRERSDYDVRPFTPEELQRILVASEERWGRGSDMWWLIRLGLYTGARLEELCQLAKANVREVSGIPVIEIVGGSFVENGQKLKRKIKNAMSERLIPLHPWLIENGFLEFAKAGKGARVLSTFSRGGGRFGHGPSKAFHRLIRDALEIDDVRVRFHSFRHGFSTGLHNASVPAAQVNALMGHARAKGAAGRYINELDTPTLAAALGKLL